MPAVKDFSSTTDGSGFFDFTGDKSASCLAFTRKAGCDFVVTNHRTSRKSIQDLRKKLSDPAKIAVPVVWVHIDSKGGLRWESFTPANSNTFVNKERIDKIVRKADWAVQQSGFNGTAKCYVRLAVIFDATRSLIEFVKSVLEKGNLSNPKYWDANRTDYFLSDVPNVKWVFEKTYICRGIASSCGIIEGVRRSAISLLDAAGTVTTILELFLSSELDDEAKFIAEQAKAFIVTLIVEEEKRDIIYNLLQNKFGELKSDIIKIGNDIKTNEYARNYYIWSIGIRVVVELVVLPKALDELFGALKTGGRLEKIVKQLNPLVSIIRQTNNISAKGRLYRLFNRLLTDDYLDDVTAGETIHKIKTKSFSFETNNTGEITTNSPMLDQLPTNVDYSEVFPNTSGGSIQIVRYQYPNNGAVKWAMVAIANVDDLIEKIMKAYIGSNDEAVKKILGAMWANEATKTLLPKLLESQNITNIADALGKNAATFAKFVEDLKVSDDFAKFFAGGGVTEHVAQAWKLMNDISDNSVKAFRLNKDILTRLAGDIAQNPKLKIFIEQKGANGFLAWKYADDAFPNRIWCIK